jgi:hypothetical protein
VHGSSGLRCRADSPFFQSGDDRRCEFLGGTRPRDASAGKGGALELG